MFMRPAGFSRFQVAGLRGIVGATRTVVIARSGRCRPLIVLALALSCLGPCLAWAERLPIHQFTMRDGLPSDSITCLVRDRAGFMWVCTTEGLAVYDGFSFRAYGTADGLPHNRVTRVLHARDGTYWIGTEDGLAQFQPKRATGESRFRVVRPPAPAHWFPDKVITNRVLSLMEDRSGRIWCGFAQAGLFVVDRSDNDLRLLTVPPQLPIDTQVNALAEGPDGTVWVATNRGLIRRRPDGANAHFGYAEGLGLAAGDMLEDIGSVLVVGPRVFVGTRLAGLHEIDPAVRPGQRAVIRSWRSQTTQGGDTVNSLTMASDGHIWYSGPAGAREVVVDAASPVPARIWGVREGLAPGNVEAVAEDADGNMWIGTVGAGAFRVRRNGFRTFTVADGLAGDEVKDLFVTQGGLHVVTANARGLYLNRFDGQQFIAAPRPYHVDPLAWGTNQLVVRDHVGDWWYATWKGVVRTAARAIEQVGWVNSRIYDARDGLLFNQAFKVFEDSRGDVWMGTWAQLHNVYRWVRATGRIERHEVRTFPYEPGLGFGFVPAAFAETTGGDIWIGSEYGGLSRFRNGRWTFYDEDDGLPAGRIQSILRDRRGRMWVGSTTSGLARVDHPTADVLVFVPVRKTDGLSSDEVLALTEDLDGFIYAGTGLGVDRLHPDTLEVRRYGVEDGLPGGPVVSATRDPVGGLWFGTRQGLARFSPSAFKDPGWPELRVMRVSATDIDVRLSDLGETQVPALTLQPHQNAVQITVGALASGPMPGLRFEGRLEGSESDWVLVEPGRPVMLLNLQPGAYRFVARATASGRVGPSSVAVAFTILRPWWQRPWAVSLGLLVLLGVSAAAYNLRVRELLAVERVRSRIASDLHDDIGASISRMALMSEAARGHQGPGREAVAVSTLGEVASMARTLATQMADVVWANDPRHDTVGNVIGRASWFGSELFALRGVEWRCTVDEAAAVRRLGPDGKRHLLLLLKEALNNVAKHAQARLVSLTARADAGDLLIEIEDDGRGFDRAAGAPHEPAGNGDNHGNGRAGGRGLANMRARARALGGNCTIETSPGQGCRLSIRLP
jgi:ligand-binding sensor domain-containing protein/signal transduction histidine kinase